MMTRRPEIVEMLMWMDNKEWYTYDIHSGYALTDKAPEEARISFDKWKKHKKRS